MCYNHKMHVLAYLSSHVRQWTSIGKIPDAMRSSIGGFRSLDSSFLITSTIHFQSAQLANMQCRNNSVQRLKFVLMQHVSTKQLEWIWSDQCTSLLEQHSTVQLVGHLLHFERWFPVNLWLFCLLPLNLCFHS